MSLVEYTVRGKQYRKRLEYKQFIPASSGKIQKDVFSSDYVYSSDRSLDFKKYFPSAQIWLFTIILRILKKPMLSAASAMKSILNICLSDFLFSFSFWLELIFSVYFCSLKSLFLDIEGYNIDLFQNLLNPNRLKKRIECTDPKKLDN